MHELLHWAARARLPIVMVNVNRALGAPGAMNPISWTTLRRVQAGSDLLCGCTGNIRYRAAGFLFGGGSKNSLHGSL